MITARARRTDPATSHEAAHRVEASGSAARQRERVLAQEAIRIARKAVRAVAGKIDGPEPKRSE